MNYLSQLLVCITIVCISNTLSAQEPSAILDLESTTQGFLPPRMFTHHRDAIDTPSDGMIIFNRSSGQINIYDIVIEEWVEIPKSESRTMVLGSAAFTPISSGYSWVKTFESLGGGAEILSDVGGFVAPINLPVGTLITEIIFYYLDNSETSELILTIGREDKDALTFGTPLAPEFRTGVNAFSPDIQSHSVPLSATLSLNYGYFLKVFSHNWVDHLTKLKAVEITYRTP